MVFALVLAPGCSGSGGNGSSDDPALDATEATGDGATQPDPTGDGRGNDLGQDAAALPEASGELGPADATPADSGLDAPADAASGDAGDAQGPGDSDPEGPLPDAPPADLGQTDVPPVEKHLVINEFVVTPTDQETIEIFNGTEAPVDISGWTLHTLTESEKVWTLGTKVIAPGEYFLIKQADLVPPEGVDSLLPNAGAELWLDDLDGNEADRLAYGIRGSAPVPIYGTSTARVDDGVKTGSDAADFNWDPTPTLGLPNDVPGVKLASPLTLSEILWGKTLEDDDYVELFVLGGAFSGDVGGWTLVINGNGSGDDYLFPEGTKIESWLWTLNEPAFPQFAAIKEKGVLYLFDDKGVRIYQVGWTGLPGDATKALGYLQGESGAADCYDTATCGLKLLTPTPGEANKL
jgi:hypothetical protein